MLMDASFLILFFYCSVSLGLLIKTSFLDAVMMGTKYYYLCSATSSGMYLTSSHITSAACSVSEKMPT
jgi:hypothetical protein